MISIPQLTKMQRKLICNEQPIDGFTIVDIWGVELGMDKHGVNMYLAVIKQESDGQLYGVPWGSSAEDYTVGDWSDKRINKILPIVPLWAQTKTITVTVYEGAGKSLLSELDIQL